MAVWLVASTCGAQDTETRIRQLEQQLEALTRELNALKEQVQRDRVPPPPAAPSARAATVPVPAPAEAASPALAGEKQAQPGETAEQVAAVQSRLDSGVPNVRLADGVRVEDPLGRWALRGTARAQFDYRDYPGESGVLANTFSVRRARIGLGMSVGKWLTSFVEAELASGSGTQSGTASSSTLWQAWVDFAPLDTVHVRVGQFKPLFGLEDAMSSWWVDFQERSLAFNLMQNFLFDRGIMLYGTPGKGIVYSVAVTNGTGQNVDEFQRNSREARADGKDTTLRLVGNAAAWGDLPDWVMHFGGSYKFGEQANGSANAAGYTAASGQTEARGITFFSPTSFNPGSANAAPAIDRVLGAVEAAVAYRSVKLQGEWQQARYSGTLASGLQFDRRIDAGYLAAAWLVTGERFADAYRDGVFGRIRPRSQFGLGPGSGWGALEVALRYSFFDASDFTASNPPLTGGLGVSAAGVAPSVTQSTNKAAAGTFALKWVLTPYTALMANYVYTRFDTPVIANGITLDAEQAVIMRAQFDFY